jgi:hypothetical protein
MVGPGAPPAVAGGGDNRIFGAGGGGVTVGEARTCGGLGGAQLDWWRRETRHTCKRKWRGADLVAVHGAGVGAGENRGSAAAMPLMKVAKAR